MASDDPTTREQRLIKEKDDIEDRLLKDLVQQQIDISELFIKNIEKESEINELKDKITQTEKEVKDLQKSKEENRIKTESYVERINVLEKSVEVLKKSVETLKKTVESLKKENKKLRKLEEYVSREDENCNPKEPPQQQQLPRIATEFSRLVHKYFARILGSRNKEVRRMQYTLRLDTIKERVISSLVDNEKLKKTIEEKFNELPFEIFEPWFSDFLISTDCPELFSTSYEAAVTTITDSYLNEGIKEDALKVIGYLQDMYDKLKEPFGGGIQSMQDQVASSSGSKRRTKSPERGENCQRKQAKIQ